MIAFAYRYGPSTSKEFNTVLETLSKFRCLIRLRYHLLGYGSVFHSHLVVCQGWG